MKYEIKKKIIKPLCIYSLAFSMLLPSLTGVVEAASDMKVSNTEKLVASEKAKTEENKKEVREDKAEVKEVKKEVKETKSEVKEEKTKEELEDILTEDEIQEIRNRANNLENDYFFNGNMVEELKAELRKAKADPSVNYQEAKVRLINEAILKNAPRQKAPGETRAITVFQIKGGDKLESGMTKITVQSRGWVKGQTIEVLVNNAVKGSYKWTINPNENYQTIKLSEALKENDKVKAILKSRDGSTILAQTQEYIAKKGQPKLAEQHEDKLKMPTGEIWIEDTSSNLVNDDEQAEAVEMLKDANTAIAGDIKLVKFSIDGTDHAYYEITYTDGSTTGKIEATDLKIKTVTETSAAPTIEKVQVTDGQIIVTLEKEVAPGTKFYFVKNFTDGEDKNFCENGSCKVVKSTSQDMSQAVSIEGKKVTFPINDKVNDLKLGKEFGIVVKEPHKFRSCAKSEPVVTIPDKVSVRDPHKLTDDDKKAIDKAIRDANTVNGKSKLPDGTGFIDDPAFIEFDKDGNVTIVSPNDVEVTWDSNYNPVYVKNPDGTYKLQSGKENNVIKIPAEDLVKNIKPDAPDIKVNESDKTKITINAQAVDTDAKKIEVAYTGKDGKSKTTTATKADDGTWSIAGEGTVLNGVITLPKDKVKGGTDVTATVTDKGGIADDDKIPLTSDPGTLTVEETIADKVEALGGLDPVALKKWVGDEVDWKDGVKAKDSATEENKGKINELLKGATFEDVTETKRTTEKSGEFTGKIKVKFDDGSKIIVENQNLIVEEIKVKISYNANGGSGNMEGKELKKGSKYKLLANGFTAPKNQEFKAWEVDGKEVAEGTEITIEKDTEVKAIWKDTMVNVSYNANGGSGNMEGKELKKGSKYKLLANGFTAPKNQEFKTWEVDGKEVAEGTEITIEKDTEVKAIWKDKTTTPDSGKPGEGEQPNPNPGTDPGTKPDPSKPDPNKPEDKPGTKPEKPSYEEEFIPGIRHRDHYTPTYPVKAVVPKTEKVEKAEEVLPTLETHKAYIVGYEDDTLRAEGNLTRAEAAAMVTRLAGLDLSDNSMPAFKDMQKNAWYFRYINAAVKANMLDADNGMMRPNDKITRAEFAKMLAAIDKENSSVSKFEDIKGHRYEKEINKIYGNNRIEGYEDGSFRPDAKLTRAESAAFLNRMFNRIADKEAYAGLEERLAKFKDFDSSKWYYDEMVEATNSHELTRRGKASDKYGRVYEKWTRILPSDVK